MKPPHLEHIQTEGEVSHKPLSWRCLCSRAVLALLLPLQQPASSVATCEVCEMEVRRSDGAMHKAAANRLAAAPPPSPGHHRPALTGLPSILSGLLSDCPDRNASYSHHASTEGHTPDSIHCAACERVLSHACTP